MTDEPFIVPSEPEPEADEVAAADPGPAAPDEVPGAGEHRDPDVFPDDEPDGDTLTDELHDRPTPPFRTPHPEES